MNDEALQKMTDILFNLDFVPGSSFNTVFDKALEFGIATRLELEEIAAAWRAWGRDPDALFCFSHTEVVAWKR